MTQAQVLPEGLDEEDAKYADELGAVGEIGRDIFSVPEGEPFPEAAVFALFDVLPPLDDEGVEKVVEAMKGAVGRTRAIFGHASVEDALAVFGCFYPLDPEDPSDDWEQYLGCVQATNTDDLAKVVKDLRQAREVALEALSDGSVNAALFVLAMATKGKRPNFGKVADGLQAAKKIAVRALGEGVSSASVIEIYAREMEE